MARPSSPRYDIFISYRRESGAETAKHLRDVLAEKGYRVFFDTDSLRSGDFNRALYDIIDGCSDFIVILSPGSLDRCVNEDDWVRKEIAHALKGEKNIIPILSNGFRFPAELPADIADLRWRNGIAVNIEYFDAMIDKLTEFLQSKPSGRRVPLWMVAIAVAAVALIASLLPLLLGSGSDGATKQTGNTSNRTRYTPDEGYSTIDDSTGTVKQRTSTGYEIGDTFEICNPETGEVEYVISVDDMHILPAEFEKNMWEEYDPEAVDLLAVLCSIENYGYHRGEEGQVSLYRILQDNTIIVKDPNGYQLTGVMAIYHGTDGMYVCECTSSIPVGSKGRFCFIFYLEKGTTDVTISLDSHAGEIATTQVELQ